MLQYILTLTLIFASLTGANCFKSTPDITENAQKIRLISKNLGWEVGKVKSFGVAGIILAKQEIYPDGNIKVCIAENDGNLKFIMHSNSNETTIAKWHFLTSSKTGWF